MSMSRALGTDRFIHRPSRAHRILDVRKLVAVPYQAVEECSVAPCGQRDIPLAVTHKG